METDHSTAVFVAELILLLSFGRIFGEVLSRFGQPAIFGQLLAGVVLGPSVFGALLPDLRHHLFPNTATVKTMIDAISQIGILLLLLLTGMETNLSLVNRKRRAVMSTSLLGILFPFVCGVALAYAMPDTLMPNRATRLATALFLGTALSISSVKIVAMVLIEVGAIRRDLGQLILTTAVLDDTIAWVLIAMIAGIAAKGTVELATVGASIGGTILFLALSLTIGGRVVARIIRWTNDHMTIEVPVITAILVVMLSMALSTELIGVHTALGAFVAGMLIGQSPILTEHIEGELRGFIIAFFGPVFFAVAGLGMDLRTLLEPKLALFTLAVIIAACFGKFLGAFAGGRLGGLTTREALALGTGLNARGSTEVIIASIGLSLGALSQPLYTMIVAMAVITTMAMPPTLRWMLARVPLHDEEAKRLDKEDAEEQDTVPRMERALVLIDDSANGSRAAVIAGLFAANRQLLVTLAQHAHPEPDKQIDAATHRLLLEAATTAAATAEKTDGEQSAAWRAEEMIQTKSFTSQDVWQSEIDKGYSIIFVGIEHPISNASQRFESRLQALVQEFDGPIAIMVNATKGGDDGLAPQKILVPTGGGTTARLATEIAMSLAKASSGALTALHVFEPRDDAGYLRGRLRRQGMSILVDARRLARRIGIPVNAVTMINSNAETAIRRAARASKSDLVVLGSALRQSNVKFLGTRTAALVRDMRRPVLLIVQ